MESREEKNARVAFESSRLAMANNVDKRTWGDLTADERRYWHSIVAVVEHGFEREHRLSEVAEALLVGTACGNKAVAAFASYVTALLADHPEQAACEAAFTDELKRAAAFADADVICDVNLKTDFVETSAMVQSPRYETKITGFTRAGRLPLPGSGTHLLFVSDSYLTDLLAARDEVRTRRLHEDQQIEAMRAKALVEAKGIVVKELAPFTRKPLAPGDLSLGYECTECGAVVTRIEYGDKVWPEAVTATRYTCPKHGPRSLANMRKIQPLPRFPSYHKLIDDADPEAPTTLPVTFYGEMFHITARRIYDEDNFALSLRLQSKSREVTVAFPDVERFDGRPVAELNEAIHKLLCERLRPAIQT